MSLLTKPSELKIEKTFKGLVYGQPGTGKTTCALSSPNPVCIDFDKGMVRVQPQHRVPCLQVDTYQQVLDLLASDEIAPFDTIVCDTLGKLIDRICDYVASKNPKARQADGQMTMKGWGEVKNTFHAFFKLIASKNKSILFVAHESEEKNGDETIKRPDCSGSARKDIVKELDFMGYMEMVGNKRMINFSPTERFYAKNALGLDQAIELPSTDKGNDFIARYIVGLSHQRLVEQAALRDRYDSLVNLIDSNITGLENAEQVNTYYAEMGKKEAIWDSAFYEKRKLADRLKEIGVEFDKASKKFADKVKVNGVNPVANSDTPPFLQSMAY